MPARVTREEANRRLADLDGWRLVGEALDGDYHCFVHAVHPDAANRPDHIVFQHDHGLPKPTSQWQAGDVIVDGPPSGQIGDPNLGGLFEIWHDGLAEVPHVRFKIGGLLMPIVGFGAERQPTTMSKGEFVDRVGPLVTWALDTFGIQRCMFASNFPMDKVSISYQTLVAGLDELLDNRTEEEKRLFFNGVARDFYRIA